MNLWKLAVPVLLALAVLGMAHPPLKEEPPCSPTRMILWSNGGALPPTEVPECFGRGAIPIVACEDRAGEGAAAVGDQGRAFGPFQVRIDFHGPRMRSLGLDPSWEPDRVRMAVKLYQERGNSWAAWSCNPK